MKKKFNKDTLELLEVVKSALNEYGVFRLISQGNLVKLVNTIAKMEGKL